jgi:4-hydroxybenzoate polyprenyltransferase
MSRTVEYLRLARFQTAAATAMIPVVGAMAAIHLEQLGDFNYVDIVMVFFIGLLMHVYGFAQNELLDREIDEKAGHLNHKPLINGAIAKEQALKFTVVAFVLMFAIALLGLSNREATTALVISAFFGTFYNLTSKHIIFSDLLIGAWAYFLFIFGALTVAPGGWASVGPVAIFLALMVFLQILYNNMILGGLKDKESDRLAGVKNFATLSSDTSVRAMGAILKMSIWIIALVLLTSLNSNPIFLMMMLVLIVIQASQILALRRDIKRGEMLRVMAIHEISTYAMFPLILSTAMGWPAIILIVIPVLFIVVFNRILWGTTLRPKI